MPSCVLISFFILIAAWLLDALIGDPEKLPHPVRAIGAGIGWLEKIALQYRVHKKTAGIIIGICVPAAVFLSAYGSIVILSTFSTWLGAAVSCAGIYYCLSTRCLGNEALEILKKLESGDVPAARLRLARIVGRDTAQLTEGEIVRATVETVSENTVDGIISPLFYAALGGAPLALAFKAVSTLDSMIGYKNEQYRELGCFSARFDDVLNFIPARLCLLLVPLACLCLFSRRSRAAFAMGRRDGRNSPSPNSGFPEACFAGALDIRLGGLCSYGGVLSRKPLIGDYSRDATARDIQRAVRLMWAVSALCLLLCTAIVFMITRMRGC